MKLCQVCSRHADKDEATCPECGEASWAACASEALKVEGPAAKPAKAEPKAEAHEEKPAAKHYHRKSNR